MYTTAVTRDSWWTLVLRGIAAVLFGVAAVFWPALTVAVLVYLFSAYLIVSGVLGVVSGVKVAERNSWWVLHVLLGIVELGVGIYLVRHITVSVEALLLLVGFTLVVRGLFEIVASYMERDITATLRTVNSVSGLIALAAGIIIVLQPKSSGVSFAWILGLYAIVFGALHVAMASQGRSVETRRRA